MYGEWQGVVAWTGLPGGKDSFERFTHPVRGRLLEARGRVFALEAPADAAAQFPPPGVSTSGRRSGARGPARFFP